MGNFPQNTKIALKVKLSQISLTFRQSLLGLTKSRKTEEKTD